jgi:hypothetical protein
MTLSPTVRWPVYALLGLFVPPIVVASSSAARPIRAWGMRRRLAHDSQPVALPVDVARLASS